jgi:hypothetical protein
MKNFLNPKIKKGEYMENIVRVQVIPFATVPGL